MSAAHALTHVLLIITLRLSLGLEIFSWQVGDAFVPDFDSPATGKKGPAKKTMRFRAFPRYLVLVMNRYVDSLLKSYLYCYIPFNVTYMIVSLSLIQVNITARVQRALL